MADFNVDAGQVPNQAPPTRPVMDTSTADAIQSGGGLLTGLGTIAANAYTGATQDKASLKEAAVIQQYRDNTLRKADLVNQGVWSHEKAQSAALRDYSRVAAQFPALADKLSKVYQDLTGTTISGVMKSGTEAEQDTRKLKQGERDDAMKAGLLTSGMTEQQQDMAVLHNQEINQAKTELEIQKKRAEILASQAAARASAASAQNSGVSAQRAALGLQSDRMKMAYRQSAGKMGASAYEGLGNLYQSILQDKTKTDEQKSLDIDNALNMKIGALDGAAKQFDDAGFSTDVLATLKNQAQTAKDALTGKLSGDMAAAKLTSATNVQANMLASANPTLVSIAASSHFTKGLDPAFQQALGNSTAALVKQGIDRMNVGQGIVSSVTTVPHGKPVDLSHTNPDEVKAVQGYKDWITSGAKGYVNGKGGDPAYVAEMQSHLAVAMNGIGKLSGTADSPQSLQTAMEIFADPAVNQVMSDKKMTFDKDTQENAARAVAAYWTGPVTKIVQDEYFSTGTPAGMKASSNVRVGNVPNTIETSKAFTPVNKNGVISFEYTGDPANYQQAKARGDQLKKAAVLLNTAVRAEATLNSSNNYSTYADEVLKGFFPEEDKAAGNGT